MEKPWTIKDEDDSQTWVRVFNKDGTEQGFNMQYMQSLKMIERRFINLFFPRHVLLIEGRNLGELVDDLASNRVATIVEESNEPSDKSKPFIGFISTLSTEEFFRQEKLLRDSLR